LIVQSHAHDAALLKTADGSVPVVSIVRHPLDAIASTVVYLASSPETADRAGDIGSIIRYYGNIVEVAANNPHVLMLPFDEVTTNLHKVLLLLETRYDLGAPSSLSAAEVLAETTGISRATLPENEQFARRGHVPRQRSSAHFRVVDVLRSTPYRAVLDDLTKMYDSILVTWAAESQQDQSRVK
jgi:hypothetical protein